MELLLRAFQILSAIMFLVNLTRIIFKKNKLDELNCKIDAILFLIYYWGLEATIHLYLK